MELKEGYIIKIYKDRKKTNLSYPLDTFFAEDLPDNISNYPIEYFLERAFLINLNPFMSEDPKRWLNSDIYVPYYIKKPFLKEKIRQKAIIEVHKVNLVFTREKMTLNNYCEVIESPGSYSFFENFSHKSQIIEVLFPLLIMPL